MKKMLQQIKQLYFRCTDTVLKKVLCIAAVLLLIAAPFGVSALIFNLSHEYLPANCTQPERCTHCNKTVGEPLGHVWENATCTVAKTCSVCSETEGKPLPHAYSKATCTTPKTCADCGATDGDPAPHSWKDATCAAPKTCAACKKTEGEPLTHTFKRLSRTEPTCTKTGTLVEKCSACGEKRTTTLAKSKHIKIFASTCQQTAKCGICGKVYEGETGLHRYSRIDGSCAWCGKSRW